MLFERFYMGYFKPQNERQESLLEDIKTVKSIRGSTGKFSILRSLVRTRKHTRTVYPPGWKLE